MNRKSFLKSSAFTLGALAFANQRLFARYMNEPTSKIRMLSDDVGVYIERGGPMLFYMGKDVNVVVDSQFPEQATALIAELKKRNPKPIDFLINTHHHIGNTSGNSVFRPLVKDIIAHENAKKNHLLNTKLMKVQNQQSFPTLTYKESWCQKFGKENICIYNYGRAHTNGDSIVHFEYADVVHLGDVVHNRMHPAIDRLGGGSIKGWMEVLTKVYQDFGKNTKFIFGHTANGFDCIGTRDDIRSFNNYLGQLFTYVENEVKRGKIKKDVVKSAGNIVPNSNPQWKGEGLDRTYAAVYDEIIYLQTLED